MIIEGTPVDPVLLKIEKSIADNLQHKNLFISTTKDQAENTVELKPPIPMESCLYVFENSTHVAKCCRILAGDIIYNDITLTPSDLDEADDHLINQVTQIQKYLMDNVDELYNLLVDWLYAGWCAMEYIWNNTSFTLQQIPIHSCRIIKDTINGYEVYLLKQQINSTIKYFKIMGETYPNNFQFYQNQQLGDASLMGGDNIYQFFSLPRWIQDYKKILTEIGISAADYQTISKGNISSGVLSINLEPQLAQPVKYDENNNPIREPTRQEVISQELQSANGGTAVIFPESNRDIKLDYVGLANNNYSYLNTISDKCQQAVLNDYNIPLIRLMINTDKESMNSDKTKSLWEIYTLNLKNEQKPIKAFIRELIHELYSLDVDVEISLPIFADRRETETKLITDAWNNGALTLKQYITALSDYLPIIDLNDYDFTINHDVWDYRKIDGLTDTISSDDLALIEQVEAQLNEVRS